MSNKTTKKKWFVLTIPAHLAGLGVTESLSSAVVSIASTVQKNNSKNK